MKIEEIKRIAVIGSGAMGAQMAEVFSRLAGYGVNLVDISDEQVKKGLKSIEKGLERFFVAKGKISAEEKEAITGRIKGYTSLEEAVKDVDFVIEAVLEIMSLKREVFEKLDRHAPQSVVLASNTSMLNITEIAAATGSPERVIGMHFFNPVAVMKLVEVISGGNGLIEVTPWL